jgi:hypothetical protein
MAITNSDFDTIGETATGGGSRSQFYKTQIRMIRQGTGPQSRACKCCGKFPSSSHRTAAGLSAQGRDSAASRARQAAAVVVRTPSTQKFGQSPRVGFVAGSRTSGPRRCASGAASLELTPGRTGRNSHRPDRMQWAVSGNSAGSEPN